MWTVSFQCCQPYHSLAVSLQPVYPAGTFRALCAYINELALATILKNAPIDLVASAISNKFLKLFSN